MEWMKDIVKELSRYLNNIKQNDPITSKTTEI
jgi:hypothetical protein